MQLLLVAEKQVAPGKTSFTLGALEGLLLCVGALMSFQMFQPSECAAASGTAMRTRLVGLGWREIGRGRLGIDSNCRSFYSAVHRLARSVGATSESRGLGGGGAESHEKLHGIDSEHTSVIALRSSNIWVCGRGRSVGHIESRGGGFQLRTSVVAHNG